VLFGGLVVAAAATKPPDPEPESMTLSAFNSTPFTFQVVVCSQVAKGWDMRHVMRVYSSLSIFCITDNQTRATQSVEQA
jgi:hypothetical protein